jgi:hypothetical protein
VHGKVSEPANRLVVDLSLELLRCESEGSEPVGQRKGKVRVLRLTR